MRSEEFLVRSEKLVVSSEKCFFNEELGIRSDAASRNDKISDFKFQIVGTHRVRPSKMNNN